MMINRLFCIILGSGLHQQQRCPVATTVEQQEHKVQSIYYFFRNDFFRQDRFRPRPRLGVSLLTGCGDREPSGAI
jgi:hypothetical protein